MPSPFQFFTSKKIVKATKQVEKNFKNLPHLPSVLVKFLVKIAPFISLIAAIFTLLSTMYLIRMLLIYRELVIFMKRFLQIHPSYYLISALLTGFSSILYFKAIAPLRKKKLNGWLYLMWNILIYVVLLFIDLFFLKTSILEALLILMISLYTLFEIKKYYKT